MVEFHEATEARAAFRKLAYTKFKSGTPLYLEWGPENAFKTSTSNPSIDAAQPNTGNQGHMSRIISKISNYKWVTIDHQGFFSTTYFAKNSIHQIFMKNNITNCAIN